MKKIRITLLTSLLISSFQNIAFAGCTEEDWLSEWLSCFTDHCNGTTEFHNNDTSDCDARCAKIADHECKHKDSTPSPY